MEFKRIFTDEDEGKLFSACYPENAINGASVDIFEILMDSWDDDEYLINFFTTHKEMLDSPFWEGMSIDEAVQKIKDERQDLENELFYIETKQVGYENYSLSAIFQPLHTNVYAINFDRESHRKGKPYFKKPMLRIYAIELEDGSFVITGGTIKLTNKMTGDNFNIEFRNLERVQEFIEKHVILNGTSLLQ